MKVISWPAEITAAAGSISSIWACKVSQRTPRLVRPISRIKREKAAHRIRTLEVARRVLRPRECDTRAGARGDLAKGAETGFQRGPRSGADAPEFWEFRRIMTTLSSARQSNERLGVACPNSTAASPVLEVGFARACRAAGPSLYSVDARIGIPVAQFGKRDRIDLREGIGRELVDDKVCVIAPTPPDVFKDLILTDRGPPSPQTIPLGLRGCPSLHESCRSAPR